MSHFNYMNVFNTKYVLLIILIARMS